MSASPLSSDDISAAADVHALSWVRSIREAVVELFLAKIDSEIGARIDARLATTPSKRDTDPVTAARRRGVATGLVSGLAVGTVVVGVPLSWFAVDIGGSAKLWHIWVVIAIVYLAASPRSWSGTSAGSNRHEDRTDVLTATTAANAYH